MKISFKSRARGFSLVELLLTLVLILCLAAASVFTFTAIYRSANLDEGYDRFQSLVRFAQAEAATTGRKVRLQFEPVSSSSGLSDNSSSSSDSVSSDDRGELRSIKVTWEADLLNAPGVFQVYTNKSWSEEMVNELVGVAKVQPLQNSGPAPATTFASADNASDSDSDSEFGSASTASSEGSADSESADFPSITFYPDGSCDSAEIVLASRNSEDDRRIAVRLSGILGSISSRVVTPGDGMEPEEDPFEEFDDYPPAETSTPALDAASPSLAQSQYSE